MKRRMWSVVLALALLPGAAAMADPFVVKSRDVDKLFAEMADWSKPLDQPPSFFDLHRFLFCQKRTRGMPKTFTESCYIVWHQAGYFTTPGYIRFVDTYEVNPESAGTWFRVTPEWNRRLKQRMEAAARPPSYSEQPPPPSNQSFPEYPRYRNGGTQDFPYWDGT